MEGAFTDLTDAPIAGLWVSCDGTTAGVKRREAAQS